MADHTEQGNLQIRLASRPTGRPTAENFTIGVAKGSTVRRLDPASAPVTTALGVLGMPGLTAYAGLTQIGRPKGASRSAGWSRCTTRPGCRLARTGARRSCRRSCARA